jgi:hypothetical protein
MRLKEELRIKIRKEVKMEMAKSIILHERPDLEILAKVVVALAEMPEENRELLREIKAKIRQIKAEMEVD